jgi:hypothetical protein
VQTFLLGVAFCKSALRGVIVCKMLIPRSAIWTRFFQLIPLMYVILQVGAQSRQRMLTDDNHTPQRLLSHVSARNWRGILQWPIFAFIGTLTGSQTVWAFLLVFTTNPLTYALLADTLHHADTAITAHEVMRMVKKVNMLTKLVAAVFLVLECSTSVAEALQYTCRQAQASSGTQISWPGGCLLYVATSPTAILWDDLKLGGMLVVETLFLVSSFLVTYYVTLLAIIDQLLRGFFFLWADRWCSC